MANKATIPRGGVGEALLEKVPHELKLEDRGAFKVSSGRRRGAGERNSTQSEQGVPKRVSGVIKHPSIFSRSKF